MVELHPVDYTNDTAIIRRNARMVAINSAIEVDLTGQVCADSIGTRLFSGVGGQMDFMRGAALSPRRQGDHRAALDGQGRTVSRIVPMLAEARRGDDARRTSSTSSPSTASRTCTARASASAPRR